MEWSRFTNAATIPTMTPALITLNTQLEPRRAHALKEESKWGTKGRERDNDDERNMVYESRSMFNGDGDNGR